MAADVDGRRVLPPAIHCIRGGGVSVLGQGRLCVMVMRTRGNFDLVKGVLAFSVEEDGKVHTEVFG